MKSFRIWNKINSTLYASSWRGLEDLNSMNQASKCTAIIIATKVYINASINIQLVISPMGALEPFKFLFPAIYVVEH